MGKPVQTLTEAQNNTISVTKIRKAEKRHGRKAPCTKKLYGFVLFLNQKGIKASYLSTEL